MENNTKITISFPQFKREKPLKNPFIPTTETEFIETLKKPTTSLVEMGFGKWSTINSMIKEGEINGTLLEKDEEILLFPGEWYSVIPDNFEIINLFGTKENFKKGISDDDIRFGCLPYGICKVIE